jgi:hypothetical protein
MTSLNNTDELVTRTGSKLDEQTLQDILDDASIEVAAYLLPYGLSSSGDQCKLAEMKYAQAGLMTRMRFDGTKPASLSISGFSSSDNIDQAISGLIKQAEDVLERYVQSQTTMANTKRTWVKRVN